MSEPLSPSSPTFELPAPTEVFVVRRRRPRYWLHILLLIMTVFSTLVVGARMEDNFRHDRPAFSADEDILPWLEIPWVLRHPARLLLGIPFAAALMTILLAHEMGHYLYCLKYRVAATLPFFIPAPTLIGTLGAFIRIRSPIRSRSALFDIGIAGPIAGFVFASVALVFGLLLSKPLAPGMWPGINLGYPLIFPIAQHVLAWFLPANAAQQLPLARVYLHPIAIAAWVGMFATALNLLPGGQLDGGHIVFSLAPRAHRWISRLTVAILIPLGFRWRGWWLWAVLLFISGMRHPQVAPWPGLDGKRKLLVAFAVIMFVLTFVPVPFYVPGMTGQWPRW